MLLHKTTCSSDWVLNKCPKYVFLLSIKTHSIHIFPAKFCFRQGVFRAHDHAIFSCDQAALHMALSICPSVRLRTLAFPDNNSFTELKGHQILCAHSFGQRA